MIERPTIAKLKEQKDRISGQDNRVCEQKGIMCEILQAVRENIYYPLDKYHMMPFIFGDFVEAVTYSLIGQARILCGLEVELMSVLFD